MLTRPWKCEAEVEARDVAYAIKTPHMKGFQHKIYQYQEITPSMAATTVSDCTI